MNKRAINYNKAFKLAHLYYKNEEPLIGICRLVRGLILKIPEHEFVKFCKEHKDDNTNIPFNDKNIKE